MPSWFIVLLNILMLFVIILLGWGAYRLRYLNWESTVLLSRFLVDITIPALVFTQMIHTVDWPALRHDWLLPLLGVAIILLGLFTGWITAPFWSRPHQRPTYLFLASIANWVYLPLPIASALYGDAGVRAVLLYNVGAQIALWTVGISVLGEGRSQRHVAYELLVNPGLIATVLGIVVALVVPSSKLLLLPNALPGSSWIALVLRSFMQAVLLVGNLTIPLALLVTGAQLGALDFTGPRPVRALTGVLIARLLLTPALALLLFAGLAVVFTVMRDPVIVTIGILIAGMPVAINAGMFAERFGGDIALASRAVFYSTLCSMLTVPLLIAVHGWISS
ncbi:MAG TPA: AEC family transporter [Armatimonadota bacterium]|nr:AEC family transporter [Armatimonadota bacterium]